MAPEAVPDKLDALKAAPEQHRLVFENESVRVLDTTIRPGERTPLHTHCWPAVHVVRSWSACVRRNDAGDTVMDSREAGLSFASGESFWGDRLGAHTLENVGTEPLHIVSIEIKDR